MVKFYIGIHGSNIGTTKETKGVICLFTTRTDHINKKTTLVSIASFYYYSISTSHLQFLTSTMFSTDL